MKLLVFILCALPLYALAGSPMTTTEQTTMRIKGTFDVKMEPREADNPQATAADLMRMSLEKNYHGTLEAVGQGEMLAVRDDKESGAYVAIEKVEGVLDSRQGSFSLVHTGIMRGGNPEYWSVKVVPDSGTDELEGLEGEMTITITDGVHYYELEYRLPA